MGGPKPKPYKRKKGSGSLSKNNSPRVLLKCSKCNEDFVRTKPAQLYCSNCGSTKPVTTVMEMSSESESDESCDSVVAENENLKKSVQSKEEEIIQLKEEIIKLKLIIAKKFISLKPCKRRLLSNRAQPLQTCVTVAMQMWPRSSHL